MGQTMSFGLTQYDMEELITFSKDKCKAPHHSLFCTELATLVGSKLRARTRVCVHACSAQIAP